jgi:hypothetical protein
MTVCIAVVPGPKPTLLDTLSYRPGRDPLAFFANFARRGRTHGTARVRWAA